MEDWVQRALERWPNVPALYGWLRLDRRGRWLIRNETIGRLQIIDVINRNYAADERGCWYFQNGPQRGYMQLERAPFLLHSSNAEGALQTHTQLLVTHIGKAFLDEDGGLYFQTEHGPAALLDSDLDWALARMRARDRPVAESDIAAALRLASGDRTLLSLQWNDRLLPIDRLDNVEAPQQLGFVLDPAPPTTN